MTKNYFLFFLIILFSGNSLLYAQNISTVAGDSTAGYNGDSIAAITAQLNSPLGIAVDDTGNIYIADFANERVRKVSAATGLISTVAGTGVGGYTGDNIPADSAQLYLPAGVAVDHVGNIYIADGYNMRIRKVSAATGLITTVAGNGSFFYTGPGTGDSIPATAATLLLPFGVCLDDTGNIYIAESGGNRIRKVSAATGLITTVAGNGTAGDSGDGAAATAAEVNDPVSLFVDDSGNIYIAESGGNRIRKVTAATGLITTIAGNGTGAYNGDNIAADTAELNTPSGVTLDNAGNVYIADAGNNRIRKINAVTGLITSLAGTDSAGYNGDGIPADTAELSVPFGVALNNNGNIYLSDADNSRIRQFALPCSGATAGAIHTAGATTACNSTKDTLSLPGATTSPGITYQWLSSATGTSWAVAGTSASYNTGTITTTTYFKAIVTCAAGAVSDTSATDTITVNASVTPSVTISVSPGTSISAGQTATFTATLTNGGSAPIYQWKKNNVGIAGTINATYSTSAISDGDVFTCAVNSSATCAIPDTVVSNADTMHVTPSGVQQVANTATAFALYPDPNDGTFTIESTSGNVTDVKISVSNVTGQVVYTAAATATSGKLHQVISLPAGLAAGVYTISIRSGAVNTNQQFIKSK